MHQKVVSKRIELRPDRGGQRGSALAIAVMALLLLGASVIAGMMYFAPTSNLKRQSAVSAGMKRTLQPALWSFVAQNYRLPCPAIDAAGLEGTCTGTVSTGIVPWRALGIAQAGAQDGWGNMIGYAVTTALAGGTLYKNQSWATLLGDDAVLISTGAKNAYALLSFGPDGGGKNVSGTTTVTASALTANERANIQALAAAGTFTAGPQGMGAIDRQWLFYEDSHSICNNVNGTLSLYCKASQSVTAQNCPGNVCGLTSGVASTTISSNGNPNGVTSDSVVVSSGKAPVLVLGTTTTSPSITTAPTLAAGSQACSWLQTPFVLTTHTLRAYFEFSTAGTAAGDGFTMAFLPAATNLVGNYSPCGGTPGGQGDGSSGGVSDEGSYLGFEQITDGSNLGTATATPNLAGATSTNQNVSTVTVSNAGAGYLYLPPVEINGGGSQAAAQVSGVKINTINVTYPGTGYIAPPNTSVVPAVIIAPAGGAGYLSAPSVTIETATATGCTGNGCTNATGTATITNGKVISLILSTPGAGYKRAPAVWLSGSVASGCATSCADAIGATSTINGQTGVVSGLYISQDPCTVGTCGTAKVNSMDVRTVALDTPGSGYSTTSTAQSAGQGYTGTPSVLIFGAGGAGSGATANATVSNGSVSGLNLTAVGSGYPSTVSVTIAGGGIAYATIGNINGGKVSDVVLTQAGANYGPSGGNTTITFTLPPPLGCTVNGTTCVAATGTANINNQQTVSGINVSGGAGYSTSVDHGNYVAVSDTTHVPATVTATVVNGQITALGLTAASVTVTVVPAPGEPTTPTAATITATVNNGAINTLSITSFGSGYTLVPTITISAPNNCASTCATAIAHVTSMGVRGIVASGTGGTFTDIPSIGINPPTSACVGNCFAATAAANVLISQIQVAAHGSGYQSSSTTVSLPPPIVLPKFGLEFRIYHNGGDPNYSNYGYHDDWGFFGSSGAASYSPAVIGSALMPVIAAETSGAYTTGTGILMPKAGTYSLSGNNVRHDDDTGCNGTGCTGEYMAALIVDSLQHDNTYHYSTSTAGSFAGIDNTAYTISPSCDPLVGNNVALHAGGFIAGGTSTRGPLASLSAPTAGGCTYDTGGTTILSSNGPIADTQNNSGVFYHSVRVEVQRYCDAACGSCGNPGTQGASYMHVAAYLDCDSAALGGQSCTDMTQNLLMAGSRVYSVSVTAAGSGYRTAPAVTISGGGGAGALATAAISPAGTVSSVTVTNAGSGYTTTPAVAFSGGNGSGVTATASLSGLPLAKSYAGTSIYAVNYCTADPGAVNWTSSHRGLSSLDSIIAGFTTGAGGATRGVLIRNVQVGTYN